MKYKIKIQKIDVIGSRMQLSFAGVAKVSSETAHPKVIMHFVCGEEDRRLPMVIQETIVQDGSCFFAGDYIYELPYIFHDPKDPYAPIRMYINVLFEDYYEEHVAVEWPPEAFLSERGLYHIGICENYLLIQCTGKRVSQDLKHASVGVKIFSWIWFGAECVLLPFFIIDAFLAEKKIVPYKSLRCANGKSSLRRMIGHINDSLTGLCRRKISALGMKVTVLKLIFFFYRRKKTEENTVGFMSVRRDDMSGNMAYVYDKLKKDPAINVKEFLRRKEIKKMNLRELAQIAQMLAVCKVIVLEEYTSFIYWIKLKPGTKIVQLWHACGAFKTFGFSRIGKPGETYQYSPNHRNYDYMTVSSENVRIWYAEGFGIPTGHVVATGVPRTDIFFDADYKMAVRVNLYEQYPVLQGRKVILFAPTFRGDDRREAHYPMDRFDVGHFMKNIPDEYVLIIKHHPFVRERHPIPEQYKDRVLDLSGESEVNDLLFVSDVVITDYSSLVFEASLLGIPMLFYTFDLLEYIYARDFYFNFKTFVPGKIIYDQPGLEQAVTGNDFEQEKVGAFAKKYFDHFDGRSSERVASLIRRVMIES